MLAESMVFLKPKFSPLRLVLCLGLLLAPFVSRAVPGDENWDSRFNQPLLGPGSVRSMAVLGNDLYVAGTFCQAGNVLVTNLARWDGTNWHPWAQELNGYVHRLFTHGTNLYVDGYFSLPGLSYPGVVRWDGQQWSAAVEGASVGVFSPYKEGFCYTTWATNAVGDNELQIVTSVGTNRTVIGAFTNMSINAFACAGSEIMMGVQFYNTWSETETNLMRWDGTNWIGMGSIEPRYFGPFHLFSDTPWIYAAGVFTNLGGTAVTNLARWDGKSWQGFSTGLEFGSNSGIASLAFYNDKIYANGVFGPNQHTKEWNIAEWDGLRWNIIPNDSAMRGLLAAGEGGVFAGGNFVYAGGKAVNGIARWDGTNWNGLQRGLVDVGMVQALAVQGSNVFVGGRFHRIGGVAATNLARWDGANWWPLGKGADGVVHVLYATGTNLYAAGDFLKIDGVATPDAGHFNGTSWSALRSNEGFVPTQFSVSGTNLFVAWVQMVPERYFLDYPYGGSAQYLGGDVLTRWTGTEWEAVLTNYNVSKLVATPTRLFAAASSRGFDAPPSYLWQWSGTNFMPVAGATNTISSLLADGELLYTSRVFFRYPEPPFTQGTNGPSPPLPPTPPRGSNSLSPVIVNSSIQKSLSPGVPRGVPVPGYTSWLGRLDGTNWWQVSVPFYLSGFRGVAIGEDLILSDGGRVLRWDGVEWETLGSGIQGYVSALAVSGNSLVVGGQFGSAGGKVSNGFAIWHQPAPTPRLRVRQDVGTTNLNSAAAMVVSWPRAFTNLQVEETSALAAGAWSRVKQVPAVFGSHHVMTNVLPAVNATNSVSRTNRFFRLSGS